MVPFPQDGPAHRAIAPELSTPPTPFADRETLEAELLALERDLGDLDRVGEMVRGQYEEKGDVDIVGETMGLFPWILQPPLSSIQNR